MARTRIKLFVSAVAVGLVATACGGGSASKDGPGGGVVYVGYGGTGQEAINKAWLDDFAKSSDVEVTTDSPATWAKVQQMVQADAVTWDVVQGDIVQGVTDNPNLQKIDCNVVKCDQFEDGHFPVFDQAVPILTFSYVLTYNTDEFKGDQRPTGIADFFDPERFPGKRVTPRTDSGWKGLLEAALLSDGVARDELYPLDVDRALKAMEPIRSDIIVPGADQQCITNVASGEAAMGLCYNGRAAIAKKEGESVGLAWGQQIQLCDYLYIPKGAPHPKNAQKVIAHMTSKANNGNLASHIAYGPANPEAEVAADAEWKDAVPSSHELPGDQAPIIASYKWWTTPNVNKAVEKISSWLAA